MGLRVLLVYKSFSQGHELSENGNMLETLWVFLRGLRLQNHNSTSLRTSFERAPNRSNRDPNPDKLWVPSPHHNKELFATQSWHTSEPITSLFLCCRFDRSRKVSKIMGFKSNSRICIALPLALCTSVEGSMLLFFDKCPNRAPNSVHCGLGPCPAGDRICEIGLETQ